MVATALAIGLVLIIGYVWVIRGFFSALLHLGATIAAGAIAFSLWEPLSLWILKTAPDRGMMLFLRDTAWGLGLAIPFAVSLTLIRVVLDKTIRANVILDPRWDYVGGGVAGLGSAIITSGIVMLSLGSLRFEHAFLGYQPVVYTGDASGRGSLVRDKSMFRPYVDELTAGFYEMVSRTAFRPETTRNTLGDLYPNLEEVPATLRFTYDGRSRNTLKPADFTVIRRYTVGDLEKGSPISSLNVDAWSDSRRTAIGLDGREIAQGHLEGVSIKFNSGAKERGGGSQVVIGPGQVRMLVEDPRTRARRNVHPVAVVSQADGATPLLGRWRFDADNVFISSVGGASDAVMAFEFPVPVGHRPVALFVKNVRVPLTGEHDGAFASAAERDMAIKTNWMNPDLPRATPTSEGGLEIGSAPAPSPADLEGAAQLRIRAESGQQSAGAGTLTPRDAGIEVTNFLGFVIRKGTERSLQVSDAGTGRNRYQIEEGEETFSAQEIGENSRGVDVNLQVRNLFTPPDIAIVQVDVSIDKPLSLLGRSAQMAEFTNPPVLVDTNGQRYEAVGFIFKDPSVYRLRYTPGRPLRAMSEAPTLSRSQAGTEMKLLFRVSDGVSITRFAIGSKVVADWSETPIKVERRSIR